MPRRSTRPLIIASRRSPLARVQAEWVGAALLRKNPHLTIQYEFVESEGDRFAGRLADAGGKGLFTSSVEALLLGKRADIAVHSMKDMPVREEELTAGLCVAAVPTRADVRDVLVARGGITDWRQLPQGASVGTASARRQAQLLRLRPDLRVELMRGNVQTRLDKATMDDLAHGGVTATLLAAAGLGRLGLAAGTPMATQDMLPAAGQGALAIQTRIGDHHALRACLGLNDAAAATCVHAERLLVGLLGADCHSPVAAWVTPEAQAGQPGFRLRARVLSPDGATCLEADAWCGAKGISKAARKAAAELADRGAGKLLAG